MAEVNSFDFSKYDIGASFAQAGDGVLDRGEAHRAIEDGWTVWDGFTENDTAQKVSIGKTMITSSGDKISVFKNSDGNVVTGVDYGMPNKDGSFDVETVRDNQGNLLSKTRQFREVGNDEHKYLYKDIYNKAGKIIKTIVTEFLKGNQISEEAVDPDCYNHHRN